MLLIVALIIAILTLQHNREGASAQLKRLHKHFLSTYFYLCIAPEDLYAHIGLNYHPLLFLLPLHLLDLRSSLKRIRIK